MRRTACLVFAMTLLGSAAHSQAPATRKAGLAEALQISYNGVKADLLEEAEAMPDADYGFRPGQMPDVRTFAQVVAHVASGNFSTCAAVKGVANPKKDAGGEQGLTTKTELVKALADSFAFCDDAFASTTDANALAFVRQGPFELTRATVLYGLLAHDAEMYGVGTVYLRLKGIVPPSTARQRKAQERR